MKEVTVAEYIEKSKVDEHAILIDVRSPMEFERGHVAEAINIPLEEIEGRIADLKGYPFVYLICRTGGRSGMAQHLLMDEGIGNTANILGGMVSWTEEGNPIAGTFSP